MALKKNTLNYLAIAAFVAVVAWLTWNANQINPGQTTLEGKPRTSFELLNIGTIGAAIAGLGALLILLFRRWSWLVASVLLGIVTVVSLAGFLWSPGQLGISDWDYYFSYHTALNKTITEFRQFPLWNPYICGGTSAIGDPEFPVFSPLFWPELLFGSSEGLQIAIFISVATFAVGVLMLAKRLSLSPLGSFFAALAASFGSVSLLEIVEGHPNILSAMWIPWVFWGWHRAYVKTIDSGIKIKSLASISQLLRNALVCGIFLALTFFQGGIYLLMYTAIAFIFLIAISRHRLAALSTSLVAGLWALGLAAIKLVPVALWLKDFQDKAYASSASILPYLHKVLLGRYLHGSENVIAAQGGGWHEYGAYIGPIVLILAAYGLWREWRRGSVKALFLAAIIALVVSSSGPLLSPSLTKHRSCLVQTFPVLSCWLCYLSAC